MLGGPPHWIAPVWADPGGDLDVSLDRPRLTAQPEQPVTSATGARHLIHDPAWRADDVVLHRLAIRRELPPAQPNATARGDGRSCRDLERRRGRDAASF